MTIPLERFLLDTNVWVFGLRRDSTFPACVELLNSIGLFVTVIPRQLLKELNVNLAEDEMRLFYQLINQHSEVIEISWEPAPEDRIKFFETQGCRKGDAVIAAHAEALNVNVIVSENRQFLQTINDLAIELISPEKALARVSLRN